jgi:hydroxymethylpyrimidine/phosphomethylpyrimidine kinase
MSKAELKRPCVLSIAGLDPSAGAGLLADIKTCEANEVFGLGVCTALTYQSDIELVGIEWISSRNIIAQIVPLLKRYEVSCIKIGIVENLTTLSSLLSFLCQNTPKIPIVWDPVIRSSSGFEFHREFEQSELRSVLDRITLVTPNLHELSFFERVLDVSFLSNSWNTHCAVLAKSIQSSSSGIGDILRVGKRLHPFQSPELAINGKHGSGCVLSSAVCCGIARGLSLVEACEFGRRYVRKFLESSEDLIGFHSSYAA